MQMPLGEQIRRLRRKQELTQAELGNNRFSKSYVSAVESGKVVASPQALRFFADKLGQPHNFFSQQLEELQNIATASNSHYPNLSLQEGGLWKLLDTIFDQAPLSSIVLPDNIPEIPLQMLEHLSTTQQAHFYFLSGMVAQKNQDFSSALVTLEKALALAPEHHHPLILNALGLNYQSQQFYPTALVYYLRALDLLQSGLYTNSTSLHFMIEFRCAETCALLSAYSQAFDHYKQAEKLLQAQQDVKTTALLYASLGFCSRMLITNMADQAILLNEDLPMEQLEEYSQQAIGFLVQSRMLSQIGKDFYNEATTRLQLAMTETLQASLRLRARKRQKKITHNASLLKDAEEQCQQVLLGWLNFIQQTKIVSPNQRSLALIALAQLVQIHLQQAKTARFGNYTSTATRNLLVASSLCQRTLDALMQPDYLPELIQQLLDNWGPYLSQSSLAIPHVPAPELLLGQDLSLSSVSELYLASAQICEELAESSTSSSFSQSCYQQANQCLQSALTFSLSMPEKRQEQLYLCDRCIIILQERFSVGQETNDAVTLLTFLKHYQKQIQNIYLFSTISSQ